MVLDKTLETPLDNKEIKIVHPKGNQPWILIGRTDAKAEALIIWPPDAKSWLIGEGLDARKDWGQGEKRAEEGEMAKCHHQLNGHDYRQTPEDYRVGRSWCAGVQGDAKSWHSLVTKQQQKGI